MKRILSIIMLSFLISYSGRAQSPACDSISSIISCGAVDSAVSLLDSYYIGGVDSSVSYSLPFTENYLGLYFSNVNLQQYAWSDVLQCCIPPRVNFSDTIASHCDTTEFVYLSLLYSQIPTDTCIPYWVYNVLLRQNVPWFADSTVFLLCSDLSTCKLGCFNYCNDTLRTACDSFNSLYYTYHQFLRGEGLTIDTALLDNIFYALYAQPLSYAQIVSSTMNCNTDTAVLTEITYSARNLSYSSSAGQYYMDFDVFATDTPANLLFSQSNVFIQYDSTIFGTNLVNSGKITASKGQAVDSPYYNLALTDSTSNMLKISITHTPNPNSLANLDSVNQQLCHLRINLTGFNLTSVAAAFDTIAMAGRSEYQETTSGLEFPYDIVRVSGLVGAIRSNSITYRIVPDSITYNTTPETLIFEVQAQTYTDLDSAYIVVSYDSLNFGTYVDSLGNLICTEGSEVMSANDGFGSFIYDFSINDLDSKSFAINVSGNYSYDITSADQYTPSFDSYQTIAICTLTVIYCFDTPTLSLSSLSTGVEAIDNGGTQETDGLNVNLGPDYTNGGQKMCPPTALPVVYDWTPSCTNAGSFEIMTINGLHFGTDTGAVYFTNADSPGTFIHTLPQDIKLWSDNFIQLLIPSVPFEGGGIAASGHFFVQTAQGYDNSADSLYISIGYANYNVRSIHNYAELTYLRDTPYVFKLDSTLFFITGSLVCVQNILNDLRCQTGINFYVDSTSWVSSSVPDPNDGINLISMLPSNSSVFSNISITAEAFTNITTGGCYNNEDNYNQIANYVKEIDITIKADPPCSISSGCYWNYDSRYDPNFNAVDLESALTHELGHAALLCHTQPKRPGGYNVMYPGLLPGEKERLFDLDSNSILGIKHMISLGDTMAKYMCHSADTASYPPSCPTVIPTSCVDNITNGIKPISSSTGFSASLYPNPYQNSTVIHIDVSAYTDFSIDIYDVVGHLISRQNIASDTSFDVPLSDFNQSAGLYLIQIGDSHSDVVLKLIKL